MPQTIDFRKSSRSRAIARAKLERLTRRVVRAVLDGEGFADAEMGALFVDDPDIQRLNLRFRGVDRPTDVIAFELTTEAERRRSGALLGDVVISVPTARRQAEEFGHSLEAELTLLLIHGTLHLLGYDHTEPTDADRMRRRETRYLKSVGASLNLKARARTEPAKPR